MTGDAFDFEFLPDGSTNDVMEIGPGRALLGINELDCSTKCTYLPNNLYTTTGTMSPLTIKARAGASSLISGILGTMTAVAVLAF